MTTYYRAPRIAYRVPRRYRRRSAIDPRLAGAAIVAVVAVAGALGHHSHHHPARPGHAVTTGPVVLAGSWGRSLLASAHLPQTRCNLAAIGGWIRAEGSDPAWRNRLDTTEREPGSYAVNSVGVQAFPDEATGLRATVTTLNNGLYGPILAALHAGNSAQAVANAVASSPWGTGSFGASC